MVCNLKHGLMFAQVCVHVFLQCSCLYVNDYYMHNMLYFTHLSLSFLVCQKGEKDVCLYSLLLSHLLQYLRIQKLRGEAFNICGALISRTQILYIYHHKKRGDFKDKLI